MCVTRGKAFCVVCRYCSEKNLLGLSKKGDDAFTLVGLIIGKRPVNGLIHMPYLILTKKLF